MARRSRLLAVLALAAVAALAAPAPAQTSPAKWSLVNADPVEFTVTDGRAEATLVIRNVGPRTETARVRVYLRGQSAPAVTKENMTVEAGDVATVPVAFDVTSDGERSGRIVVDDSTAGLEEPGVVGMVLEKRAVVGTLAVGLGLVVIVVAAGALLAVRWRTVPVTGLSAPLEGLDTKWSFTDSWASSLTAGGAVLGTVLAASGFAGDYLAGISAGAFVAANLLWGGLVVLAPLVYSAAAVEVAQSPDVDVVVGTRRGMLLAAFLTTTAVLGELATLGLLIWHSDLPPVARAALVALLTMAAGVVGLYVWVTLGHTLTLSVGAAPAPGDDPLPPDSEVATTDAGVEGPPAQAPQVYVVLRPHRRSVIL